MDHQTLLKNKTAAMSSETVPTLTTESRLPERPTSNYRQIRFLKEAGEDVNFNEYRTNPDRITRLLRDGVVYKDKKKRYWVDKDGRDCFAIYPRALSIDNSDRSECWRWMTESDGVELAEVVNMRWLGISGSFLTRNLTFMVTYKVSFRLMTTPTGNMKKQVVNLKLTCPDGTRQERKAELPDGPLPGPDPWHDLEVGCFNTMQGAGRLEFAMEQSFGEWKTGLIIKCAEIKSVPRPALFPAAWSPMPVQQSFPMGSVMRERMFPVHRLYRYHYY